MEGSAYKCIPIRSCWRALVRIIGGAPSPRASSTRRTDTGGPAVVWLLTVPFSKKVGDGATAGATAFGVPAARSARSTCATRGASTCR